MPALLAPPLVRHIIRHTSDSVVNVDKLTYAGNLASLAECSASPRYAFEQVDICHRAELDRVLAQHEPDAVMHLAAESHVDRSIDGPAASSKPTSSAPTPCWKRPAATGGASDSAKKSAFRFHHISTDEVYGDLHWHR